MGERLTPEAQEQLRALARKISVSQELDPKLQDELYGHLEDKATGYLSGEEAVSVEDAVLLTREHFGNARMLKSWLSSIHTREATVSTMRRIGAIAVVTMVAELVRRLAHGLGSFLVANHAWVTGNKVDMSRGFVTELTVGLCVGVCVWWVLSRWRNREARGETVWYARWRGYAFGVALLLLFVAQWLIPCVVVGTSAAAPPHLTRLTSSAWMTLYSYLGFVLGCYLPVLWLWWCDRPPRRWQACMASLVTYLILQIVGAIPFSLGHFPMLFLEAPGGWSLKFTAFVLPEDLVAIIGGISFTLQMAGTLFLLSCAVAILLYLSMRAVWGFARQRLGRAA